MRTSAPIRCLVASRLFEVFVMAKTLNVTINVKQMEEAKSEFFFVYGLAMSQWADIERGLYYWFAGITGMKAGMSRAIFYGAKGFGSRAEMLEAAIAFADKQSPEEIELVPSRSW